MKFIFLIAPIFLTTLAISQNLNDKIEGRWICIEIIDSLGNQTVGKFGTSNEYLQFHFKKPTLSIIKAPFDHTGVELYYELSKKDSTIEIVPQLTNILPGIPEQKYKVLFSDSVLILKTKNESNETIYYNFIRQNNQLSSTDSIIDLGLLIIKHLKSPSSGNLNYISEYVSTCKLYCSTPIFKNNNAYSLGDFLSKKFSFPLEHELDKISDELVVEFTVSKDGVESIKIVRGISKEIDYKVIELLKSSSRNWQPIQNDGEIIPTINRLHVVFLLGQMEWPNSIKVKMEK